MTRTIRQTDRRCALPQDLPDATGDEAGFLAWLTAQVSPNAAWLLAHTVEGVVWGKVVRQNGQAQLVTSTGRFGAHTWGRLCPRKIESCRLFGEDGELLVWRARDALRARFYGDLPPAQDATVEGAAQPAPAPPPEGCDGQTVRCRYFDELQVLWGTQVEPPGERGGFTLVSDGVEGLYHAVPLLRRQIPFDPPKQRLKQRPLRLLLRHYLEQEPDGTLRIAGSRLVSLGTQRLGGIYAPAQPLPPETTPDTAPEPDSAQAAPPAERSGKREE